MKRFITTDEKFGKLRIKEAQELGTGSAKKIECICDCGRETVTESRRLFSGKTKSCGKCNLILAKDINGKWYGDLTIEIPKDILLGSSKKIGWICKCGRKTNARPDRVTAGYIKSCGRCNEITIDEMKIRKFGKLRIKYSRNILPGSHKKEWWLCDCGEETFIAIYSVTSGNTTCCGKCNLITAEEMKIRKFGKLSMLCPKDIYPGSHEKEWWLCDCGNETLAMTNNVFSGNTTSCGKCNLITAEEMKIRKFGKLIMIHPKDVTPGLHDKEEFLCDCGKKAMIAVGHVLTGRSKSCGNCSIIPAEKVKNMKFGRLKIKEAQDIKPRSDKKVECICDCGNETIKCIKKLCSGQVTSCGRCSEKVKLWYINNKDEIKKLKCPIKPEDFPPGGIIPLETITSVARPFKAICLACGKIYYPRFGGIKNGISLTCGCAYNMTSITHKIISQFIQSFGIEVIDEFKINKFAYDIFVPSHNLLIEYNGIKWHASEYSIEKDARKQKLALDLGYEFMCLLEEDWVKDSENIKLSIKNKLNIL